MKAIAYLPIRKLKITRWPTKMMEEDEFNGLKKSIAENGILNPVLVMSLQSVTNQDTYEVLEGRHRVKAAAELGISEIPCIVFDPWLDMDVITSATYDTEVYRKNYSPEEKQQYLKIKEQENQNLQEKAISMFANSAFSQEQLQKLTGHTVINSRGKMLKLLSVIDSKRTQEVSQLQKQLEKYKENLAIKEDEEKRLRQKLLEAQQALQNLSERFKQEFEERLKERLQKELEKEIEQRQKLNQDTSEETLHRIKAELERELRAKLSEEYQQEIEEKERDIEELNRNLVDISKNYKALKESYEALKHELEVTKKQNDFYSRNIALSENMIKQLKGTIEKLSTPQNLINQINHFSKMMDNIYELAVAASSIGFTETELENTKIAIAQLKNKIEKLQQHINQQKPWDEGLPNINSSDNGEHAVQVN